MFLHNFVWFGNVNPNMCEVLHYFRTFCVQLCGPWNFTQSSFQGHYNGFISHDNLDDSRAEWTRKLPICRNLQLFCKYYLLTWWEVEWGMLSVSGEISNTKQKGDCSIWGPRRENFFGQHQLRSKTNPKKKERCSLWGPEQAKVLPRHQWN